MAVIEQRGNSLRVNWRLGGSREGARQSVTFQGSPTARLKLAQAAKALVESRNHDVTRPEVYKLILGTDDTPAGMPTFKQWVDDWLDGRARMRDIQPDVIVSYRRILHSRAVPFLGHLRLSDIDHEVLRNWVAWMSSSRITVGSKNRRTGDRLLSARTIRAAHSIVHACLGGAVPKWLPSNPAARPPGAGKHVTGLPKGDPFEGMFLTVDEVNLILEHCDDHIRDLAQVAVHTGMRMGELVALEVRNVVFSATGATILVRQALKNDGSVGPPKSAKSRRDVTVGPETARLLAARCQGRKPKALVFPSPEGGMWDEGNLRARYWFRAVAAAMRCPEHPPAAPAKPKRGPTRALRHDEVSQCACPTRLHRRPRFHDLRHTAASMLIAEGWPAKKIQLRLGHASYQTTMNVYGHLMDLGNADELDGIERRLTPARSRHRSPAGLSAPRRVRPGVVRRLRVRRSAA